MRVIAVKTLRLFWLEHPDSAEALKAWVAEAESADWQDPEAIKRRYRSADFLAGNRVVFNIRGNRYRLVVRSITTRVLCLSGSSARIKRTAGSMRRRSSETESAQD